MNTLPHKAFATILFLVLLALPGFSASASTLGVAETYTLPADTTLSSNAYLAGGTVIISGPIKGDALVAGGNTTFSGIISGDVLTAAGSSEMLGAIAGDLRGVSGTLTVANEVGGDISFVGGSLSLIESSHIKGDALLVGGKLSLLGMIDGTVFITGGDIFIDGKIGGNVRIYSSGKIRIGGNAVIAGDMSYRAADEALIDPRAVIRGKTNFEYMAPVVSAPDARGFFAGLFGLLFIARILIVLAAALLFVMVFRRASGAFAREGDESFWKNTLVGIIVLVSVPAMALLLVMTIVGTLVSIIIVVLWVLALMLAHIYAGVLAAAVFRKRVLKRGLEPVVSWRMAALGVLGINVLCLVPYVGILIFIVFFLASLGTLSTLGYRHFIVSR